MGYGTARYLRDRNGPYARFGFLVHPDHQGAGIGRALALALYRSAVDQGVGRGGGVIARENAASRHVIEGLGFRLAAAGGPASGDDLQGLEDLRSVLQRAAAPPPPVPSS